MVAQNDASCLYYNEYWYKIWGILCKAGPVLVSFAARREPNGCKTKLFTGWFRFHPSPMAMSSGQWLKYWYCGCHLFHALSSASSHLSRCCSWQQFPYSITLLASSLPKWRTILIFLITFTPPTQPFPWDRQRVWSHLCNVAKHNKSHDDIKRW